MVAERTLSESWGGARTRGHRGPRKLRRLVDEDVSTTFGISKTQRMYRIERGC